VKLGTVGEMEFEDSSIILNQDDEDFKVGHGLKQQVPIFLRKTFDMINTCDQNLCSWADDGMSFVVKDPDELSCKVIPQYFKHNNFSSFVRQLNFYGFRKVKLDPIKINLQQLEIEGKYWHFKHEKFRRGRSDMLWEVRKSTQTPSTAGQQEFDAMKLEVASLKLEVGSLRDEMRNLVSVVEALTKSQKRDSENCVPQKNGLKRSKSNPDVPPIHQKCFNTASNQQMSHTAGPPCETLHSKFVPNVASFDDTIFDQFNEAGSFNATNTKGFGIDFSMALDARLCEPTPLASPPGANIQRSCEPSVALKQNVPYLSSLEYQANSTNFNDIYGQTNQHIQPRSQSLHEGSNQNLMCIHMQMQSNVNPTNTTWNTKQQQVNNMF